MSRGTLVLASSSSVSPTRLSLSPVPLPRRIRLPLRSHVASPQPRKDCSSRFGLFPFRSPLLRESLRFLFLALLRCFSSGGSPHIPMNSVYDARPSSCGFLHSEICGSRLAYSSPQLIAVNHVLLRLPMPRHSPCAHVRFTFRFRLVLSFFSDHYAK